MRRLLIISMVGALLPVAQAIDVTSPNANALLEGDSNNGFPFTYSGSAHYQQVYAASQFTLLGTNGGNLNFVAFRFRFYNTTPATYYNMRLSFSSTAKPVDGLDPVFDANVGPDSTVVFSGKYILGVSSPFPDHQPHPWPFQMVIPFTTPFFYNPTNGNLLLDIQWAFESGGGGGSAQDAVNSSSDSVSRVFAENIFETYIPTNGTADTIGLVTMLGVSPVVPPSPRINAVIASGTNLAISASKGAPGVVGYVLATTNLATSVTGWVPIATNAFDVGGNFVFTNAMDTNLPQQFYILQLQ